MHKPIIRSLSRIHGTCLKTVDGLSVACGLAKGLSFRKASASQCLPFFATGFKLNLRANLTSAGPKSDLCRCLFGWLPDQC